MVFFRFSIFFSRLSLLRTLRTRLRGMANHRPRFRLFALIFRAEFNSSDIVLLIITFIETPLTRMSPILLYTFENYSRNDFTRIFTVVRSLSFSYFTLCYNSVILLQPVITITFYHHHELYLKEVYFIRESLLYLYI